MNSYGYAYSEGGLAETLSKVVYWIEQGKFIYWTQSENSLGSVRFLLSPEHVLQKTLAEISKAIQERRIRFAVKVLVRAEFEQQ